MSKNWKKVLNGIIDMRKDKNAPVDLYGAHILPDKTANNKTYRYQVLIGVLLSSQTKDTTLSLVMKDLQDY